ncbi:hypothetical protein HOLleu_37893 [Holothuria leucospilota]|uniref:Uncharacterized protein n=1 Tax=Holothuria leucospilota TaxID=206669 RepID=A0A9Q0YHV6_HOLLE|nr:hypothetical protein HOLleu_37893 [Holothuria leucospilota]
MAFGSLKDFPKFRQAKNYSMKVLHNAIGFWGHCPLNPYQDVAPGPTRGLSGLLDPTTSMELFTLPRRIHRRLVFRLGLTPHFQIPGLVHMFMVPMCPQAVQDYHLIWVEY